MLWQVNAPPPSLQKQIQGCFYPTYGYLICSFPTKYVHASNPLPTCLKFQ